MEANSLSSKVELHFKALGLANKDLLSKSDPFVVIFIRDIKGLWIEKCRTSTIWNNVNPEWSDQILIDYHFETVQDLKFDVYDRDAKSEDLSKHDFIGSFTTSLSKIMGSRGATVSGPLMSPKHKRPQGKLIVNGQEVSGSQHLLHFEAKGVKLDRKNLMGFGRSDPFYVISQMNSDGTFVKVFESEVKMRNLNPKWKKQTVSMQRICNGDAARPLNIEVFDYESSGKHQLIGSFQTTVEDMKSKSTFTLVHPKIKKASCGTFELISFRVEERHSFLDYIRGGCELNLIVGIDFTASNGHPLDEISLHRIPRNGPYTGSVRNLTQLNEYQRAIWSTGIILEDYDSDKMIGIYGFGGQVNGHVSHCFPLGMNGAEEVHGINGVMGAYENALKTVNLSGPTYFAPLIHKACEMAKPDAEKQKYTVLLIITDGAINDMDATIRNIVEGASLPLSIVIVGVGNADFTNMEELDGDEVRLSYMGRRAERDIVQFVPFQETFAKGPTALSEEVLQEIPEQVVSYFTNRQVKPNPPRTASESHFQPLQRFQSDSSIVSNVGPFQSVHMNVPQVPVAEIVEVDPKSQL